MMIRTDTMVREDWLLAAWREVVIPRYASAGLTIPDNVHISLGFSDGRSQENAYILGVTYAAEAATDGSYQVFVSPFQSDGMEVLRTLMHEAAHVLDDLKSGHDKGFQEIASKVGFEAPFTTSLGMNPAVQAEMILAAETLGDFPHAGMEPLRSLITRKRTPVVPTGSAGPVEEPLEIRWSSGPRKQHGSRMIKLVCPVDGYTVRTTRKWIDELGTPICPVPGHGHMVEA